MNQLIARYKNGDQKAFAELFYANEKLVYYVVRRFVKDDDDLIKDYCQNIWLKILLNLDKFDGVNFKGWVKVMARRECIDQFRKEKFHERVENEYQPLPSEYDHEKDQIINEALKEIDTLSQLQGDVIFLRLQKMPYKQISKLTKVPVDTMLSCYVYAIRNLRKGLIKRKIIKDTLFGDNIYKKII